MTNGGEIPQGESWDAAYGSARSRRVERAVDRGEMIPSSRAEARLLMAFGALLCAPTIALIAASA